MKMSFMLFAVFVASMLAEDTSCPNSNSMFEINKENRMHSLTFTNFEEDGEYSVTVNANGGAFVSASASAGVIVTPEDQTNPFNSANALKIVGTNPDAFNFTFCGFFRPYGNGQNEENDLFWSIDVNAKFYSVKSGNFKEIVSLVGSPVMFNSYENSQLIDSTWLVTRLSDSKTIVKNKYSNFSQPSRKKLKF